MKSVMEASALHVHFKARGSFIQEIFSNHQKKVKAVDGVNIQIGEGEIFSLVGESGSGKTTVGKALLALEHKTSGSILFNGEEIPSGTGKSSRRFRQKAQMIFQDPYQSLNPRDIVLDIVGEPLVVNNLIKTSAEKRERVIEALGWAGLRPQEEYLYRLPHELSGGQRQRVAIAAALILNPQFIVADEPVSMLDVSIRADILRLMVEMRDRLGISYLFITHDLSLAWLISDRIAIMYLGKIMEIGSSELIVGSSLHPYTQALISVMPLPRVTKNKKRLILKGETPDPIDLPVGCRFNPRCPVVQDICRRQEPELAEVTPGHQVACHFPKKLLVGAP
ncbi:MAG: ABC transporter ATP-binding protein [Spirochaetales bacterium]|nr:ABC transporter ATP-binding protein [Spirochaetales bacterium]